MTTSLVGYNQSAGGNNIHIVGCAAINRRQHYCICVNFLRAIEEERLHEDQFSNCQQALKNGDCVAKKMREEEKEAGIPIYFTPRTEKIPNAVSKPEAKTSYRSPARSVTKPVVTKVDKQSELVGSDMSAVINAAVNEVKFENTISDIIKPRKGESLMAFAVRYREANV